MSVSVSVGDITKRTTTIFNGLERRKQFPQGKSKASAALSLEKSIIPLSEVGGGGEGRDESGIPSSAVGETNLYDQARGVCCVIVPLTKCSLLVNGRRPFSSSSSSSC